MKLTSFVYKVCIRQAVLWRDFSDGTTDRLDLRRAITTRVTVTRCGLAITSPRTTRPPRHNHLSLRMAQSASQVQSVYSVTRKIAPYDPHPVHSNATALRTRTAVLRCRNG
ncbi:hypothetical protein Y032_0286g1398 [Ancylostoma ceylanicum]|uniref:Uncharacterized protein n=1 Tax=Ancylostoma ceylanicum TaxID=53326 RepID=A0A016S5Y9_9BILA|nr:hypothetical protein Y032_0286g1398 [Ancylostoma ceylanicum]